MNQRMKTIAIWIGLGGMILFSAGCAVLGVGAVGGAAAGSVYLNGEHYHAYSAPMEKAWKASEDVMAEMEMKVTEQGYREHGPEPPAQRQDERRERF